MEVQKILLMLLDAGIVQSERKVLEISRAVNYTDDDQDIDIHVIPSDRFRVTFMVEYPLPALGTQYELFIIWKKILQLRWLQQEHSVF